MLRSKRYIFDDRDEAALNAEIEAYKSVFEMHRPCDSGCYTPIDRNDPSTWRRPNLDTLKASVLADWKADAETDRLLDLTAAEHPAETDRKAPSTWRQPNLDNLKASVIADWKEAAVKARFSEVIAEEQPVLPKRDDPNTWSRPNLDNLKASILADWKTSA